MPEEICELVTVVRKGSRAVQPLPASPDAFVWLRLYQEQLSGLVPGGPDDPLWWTLRRPFRPLAYHAARAMFGRANAALSAARLVITAGAPARAAPARPAVRAARPPCRIRVMAKIVYARALGVDLQRNRNAR